MGIVQEKFQTVAPDQAERHNWVSSESARRRKSSAAQSVSSEGIRGTKLNQLPPGDNVGDQQFADVRTPKRVMADESDVTRVWGRQAIEQGYVRRNVSPTDDAYTQEHYDPFYRSARSGNDEGCVERNNVLDRI